MNTKFKKRSIGFFILTILLAFNNTMAQQSFQGKVVDELSQAPLMGASVSIRGTEKGTVTDENGNFELDVASFPIELSVSYIGYTTRRLQVESDQMNITIALTPQIETLNRVTVTATRTPKRNLEVPQALSVRSAQAISDRGVVSAPEALVGITGVNVQFYTEGNFPIIRMRGAGDAGILQNTDVLVLVDGVPQVNVNGQSYYNQIPLEGVERIEVVRGPTSALYGRNGIGGAINIITKEAPSELTGTLRLSGGSFNTFRPQLSLGGSVSDNVRLYGSFTYDYTSGWKDNTERRAFDTYLRADFDLGGKTTASLKLNDINIQQESTSQLPIDANGNLIAGIDRRTDFGVPGAVSENNSIQVSGNISHQFNESLKLDVVPYFRSTDRILTNDGSFIDFVDTENQELDRFPFEPILKENILGVEPRLNYAPESLNGKVDITIGGMFETNSGDADSYSIITDGSGDFGVLPINYVTGEQNLENLRKVQTRNGEFSSDIYAGYIQTIVKPLNRLSLTAGLRYDYTSRTAEDPLRTNDFVEADYEKFSPQFGISYGLTSNHYLYANYGQGFNPPWGLAFTFEREGVDDLEPETARNLEFGIKSNITSRISATLAYYFMNRTDLVQSTRVDGTTRQVNAGELDVNGLEFELFADLGDWVPGLSITGNYTYTNTEWQDFQIGENNLNGTSVVGNPENLASFNIDLRKEGFQLGAWVDHVGSWYIDRSNTVETDPYTLVNFRAQAGLPFLEGLSLGATAFNIFDIEYFTRTDFDFGGNPVGASPGRPVWFLFNTVYQF